MTPEQKKHYLKGGKFLVKYQPTKTEDIPASLRKWIGSTLYANQNMIITPLEGNYPGQHAFSLSEFMYWVPEEDIEFIQIVPEFIDDIQEFPRYLYRLTYSTVEQMRSNFGNGFVAKNTPYSVVRDYTEEKDQYILGLSTIQADTIEKTFWNGEEYDDIKWTTIFKIEK